MSIKSILGWAAIGIGSIAAAVGEWAVTKEAYMDKLNENHDELSGSENVSKESEETSEAAAE